MSYYQGDYYRGGFLSFLGGLAKKAVGFIPGIGPMASTAIGAVSKVAPQLGGKILKGAVRHPVLSAAAAAGVVSGGAAMMHHPAVAAMAGAAGRGMHISKKTGALVKNRHMRVTNPRALRRALRRAHGFAKLAMRTIHIVHPRKKGSFGGYKKKRKS